ncbi:MAG TPA: AI-2E family transporter [Gammaproteobacteria bacterium]|jgi:putative permease|nr:AI-2E family transporter [Gammaproteobacteria bacterium]
MNIVTEWYHRYVSDPQVVILAVLLAAGSIIMLTLGQMLAPVLAGVVIAYLLDGVVEKLNRMGMPRLPAVVLVFLVFMTFVVFAVLWLAPRLSEQVTQLVRQLPDIITHGQNVMLQLPEKYPNLFTEEQVKELGASIRTEITELSQRILSLSVPAVTGLIALLVYIILVPVLSFFFLKDKYHIFAWFSQRLPQQRRLVDAVASDVNVQVANYVRGKVWEIFIVGAAAFATFSLMGLQYALLLSTMVGLSVIIPYIGAAVVTVPVAMIAWFQWGWSADFGWVLFAYAVLQALDGNLLAPLLFSEVVNLHPVAIIVAILVFGGIWGFWGVFFAIPLATLVQAVMTAWPRMNRSDEEPGASAV